MVGDLYIVADNIRSIENTGALFRLTDGVGSRELLLVGITPYPDLLENDRRRPWLRNQVTQRLKKTALSGMNAPFKYFDQAADCLEYLQEIGALVLCVEQTDCSVDLYNLEMALKSNNVLNEKRQNGIAIVVGHEVEGVSDFFIDNSDLCVQIPMYGHGKSLNVSVAAGIVAYEVKGL